METLLTWLAESLNGSPWLAIVAAGGWGLASLLLSPCHLASIPLIVGFLSEREETSTRQALLYSLLFALGILGSIACVGGLTLYLGRMAGDAGPWAGYLVAGIMILVGLHLLRVLPLPWSNGPTLPRYRGKAAALVLGLAFGLALGPCTFAYLAPVLGAVFTFAKDRPAFATVLLLSYGVGHCLPIMAAGGSVERVQKVLDWNSRSGKAPWLRRLCGVLVLFGAAWLLWTQ